MDMRKLLGPLGVLTKRTDIALAVFLVLVIVLMILPLPTFIVDSLIAFNLGTAIVLLMVAIYIKTPLDFLAFPSVLLLSTLSRLALSIATTRLILLDADAGRIVDTFGNFVVGGNLIVGLVIFLIITIVQFLVITKGSERVAEVSARFSLDGMPGKQMSIDSDMRAGLIDMEQARHRRSMIEKETQLYGAMDGAMKFVKGDAIAGLIIILVNIIGGILIGAFQLGLPIAEAMQTYSILTVGDGLIAQIPALLISVTAGIIVTRVGTEESKDLSSDLTKQITSKPKALIAGSGILFGAALVPGFPTAIFATIAIAVGTVGYIMLKQHKGREMMEDEARASGAPAPQKDLPGSAGPRRELQGMTTPIIVELPMSLSKSLPMETMREEFRKMRDTLYQNLGVPFPGVSVQYSDATPAGTYRILFHEIPVADGDLPENRVLVRNQDQHLEVFDIPYEEMRRPFAEFKSVWVHERFKDTIEKSGINYLSKANIISYHLYTMLTRQAAEFIGIQETKQIIQRVEQPLSELVREAQRLLPLQKMAEIFQRLVSEGISIRNMRSILESIVEWAAREKDIVQLAEYVRTGQKRFICHKFANPQKLLPAYLIEESAEEIIRGGIRMTSAGAYLALDPEVTEKFIQNIKQTVGNLTEMPEVPVLITSMDVRRYIRKLIELDLYELPVISFQELTQDVTVQPLGRIGISA